MQRVKLVIMMVVLSAGLSGQSVELVELANPANCAEKQAVCE